MIRLKVKFKLPKDVNTILATLARNGFKAYVVGGAVRDLHLGFTPKEYDIVTDANVSKIEKLFKKTIPVGKQFGIIIAVLNGTQCEIATFRKDGLYEDGRHPKFVTKGTIIDDVKRRDFTINGLIYDEIKEEIVDYVDGLKDIEKGIIRTIGSPLERFSEDRLRMLRAVRFACNLNFKIEDKTFAAIKKNSHFITDVSAERIRDELTKILISRHPALGLDMLKTSKLLQYVLPEVKKCSGVKQPPQFHPEGDVYNHTKIMLPLNFKKDPILAWAVLLHDIGKPPTFELKDRIRFNDHCIVGANMAKDVLTRLRFSNREIKLICALIEYHMRFRHVKNMRLSKLKRFLFMPDFERHLELHRIDCLGSHKDLSLYKFVANKIEEFKKKKEIKQPKALISGNDLIKIGYKPGPIFKKILNFAFDLQLENKKMTKKLMMKIVKEKF